MQLLQRQDSATSACKTKGHHWKGYWHCSRRRFNRNSLLLSFVHCNHRSGHLKTEHTESLFLLRRHLGSWPRSKHEKRAAGSAWETWRVAASDGVRCARARWEINFLLTFETASFVCVYPVFIYFGYACYCCCTRLDVSFLFRNLVDQPKWKLNVRVHHKLK